MNKITIIGNLTANPETRATSNGVTVCCFTVAVNRRFKNTDGNTVTDFFRVNAWRQLGENCSRFLSKGKKVAVVGELQARTYDGKDGKTYLSLDVSADEIEFLSPKTEGAPKEKTDEELADSFTDISADDIPF